ncbi:MAG: penicillin acylase family protein, partial [Bacteroidota bacterium]
LFNSWYDSLYVLTFDEIYQVHRKDHPMEKPEAWRFVQLLEADSSDPIFDSQTTPTHTETREELTLLAFQKASAAVHEQLAAGLDWSAHRATNIPHLAGIPGFDSGPITTDGAKDTPNSMATSFAPSWRMVVSLEQPIRAWGVLPGGASGNAGSPFYTTGLKEWSQGEYFELKLYSSAEEVDAVEWFYFKQ